MRGARRGRRSLRALGAGPRSIEANAHRADERLPLASLHQATKVVALALFDLLVG